MSKRPLSITIIGWLFIATGVVGIAYHATELKADRVTVDPEDLLLRRHGRHDTARQPVEVSR